MIYNNCSTEDYKSPKIDFGTIMRNPEMLKFVPDHFKIKKVCKHAAPILLLSLLKMLIHNISRSEAINLLKDFVLDDRGYI